MALFRIGYTEVTVDYMNIEADSEEEVEEFLEMEKEYHRCRTCSLLGEEVIDIKIDPISWEESGSAVTCHDEVKAWMDAYEEGALSIRTYCKL